MRLVLIGLTAGFFSALFGVGGGVVIVPLLLLGAGFHERRATGTSLAAIVVVALAGVIAYSFRGEVHFGYAALLGLPAAAGAIGGVALQQRLPVKAFTFAFAGLLVIVGISLLL